MKKFFAFAIGLTLALCALPAAALTFDGTVSPTPSALPSNFSLDFDQFGETFKADELVVAQSRSGADLAAFSSVMSNAARLKFTYHGSEAGFTNRAIRLGDGVIFDNKVNNPGDTWSTIMFSPGPLDLRFCTLGTDRTNRGCVNNNRLTGGSYSALNIATSDIFDLGAPLNEGIVMFFGDGFGDNDLDDMVVSLEVSAIPVPASGLLLIAGLGGLAAVRRKKKQGALTAANRTV